MTTEKILEKFKNFVLEIENDVREPGITDEVWVKQAWLAFWDLVEAGEAFEEVEPS